MLFCAVNHVLLLARGLKVACFGHVARFLIVKLFENPLLHLWVVDTLHKSREKPLLDPFLHFKIWRTLILAVILAMIMVFKNIFHFIKFPVLFNLQFRQVVIISDVKFFLGITDKINNTLDLFWTDITRVVIAEMSALQVQALVHRLVLYRIPPVLGRVIGPIVAQLRLSLMQESVHTVGPLKVPMNELISKRHFFVVNWL